jgi:hypothetical protein
VHLAQLGTECPQSIQKCGISGYQKGVAAGSGVLGPSSRYFDRIPLVEMRIRVFQYIRSYQSYKVETKDSGERTNWRDSRVKSDEMQELQRAATPRQLLRHLCNAACLNDWYRRRGFVALYCSTNRYPIVTFHFVWSFMSR